MENKKLTKKDLFNALLNVEGVKGNETFENFINHEIELLNKKSSKSGQTKTQKENEDLKNVIVEELTTIGKAVTISELQAESEKLGSYSNQKLSALLKQLVDTNQVVKSTDKKKSYFSIVD